MMNLLSGKHQFLSILKKSIVVLFLLTAVLMPVYAGESFISNRLKIQAPEYSGSKVVTFRHSSTDENSNDAKVAVDFLKYGIVSDDLDNIIVTIKDLIKYMPELKPFAKEMKGTKIAFSSKMGTYGGKYEHEIDTITYNIANIEDSFYHEMQHAIDIKYIKSHPKNKDLQAILESCVKVNDLMHDYEKENCNTIDKFVNFINQKPASKAIYNKLFSEEEQKIITTWYNEYMTPYYENILEVRARESGQKCMKQEITIARAVKELRKTSAHRLR